MLKYFLVSSGAGGLQIIVTWVLIVPLQINLYVLEALDWIGEAFGATAILVGYAPGEPLANLIGIAAGTVVNFVLNNIWTFKKSDDSDTPTSTGDADEPNASRSSATATPR